MVLIILVMNLTVSKIKFKSSHFDVLGTTAVNALSIPCLTEKANYYGMIINTLEVYMGWFPKSQLQPMPENSSLILRQ